jgi:hypothetical protein
VAIISSLVRACFVVVFMVVLLTTTFIAPLPDAIKHNPHEERKRPPGSNPAAGGNQLCAVQGLIEYFR